MSKNKFCRNNFLEKIPSHVNEIPHIMSQGGGHHLRLSIYTDGSIRKPQTHRVPDYAQKQ